jgi:hypothetical protein
MGLLWRLFAPKGLKKARRAMHPSWVLEDAVVRSARKSRRQRRAPRRTAPAPPRTAPAPLGTASAPYRVAIQGDDIGQFWRCPNGHTTRASANRCANAMDERIKRLGWEQAIEAPHDCAQPLSWPEGGGWSRR